MKYAAGDVAWLLGEWRHHTDGSGEYLTWRRLAGRYPGKSNLTWLWGLVEAAVAEGYLTGGDASDPVPDADSRVTWDRWQLTLEGRRLLGEDGPPPT
jgi:hypothetical protein